MAERGSRRMRVAKSSSVGITFSMPVITQWMRGIVVTMSALPSLVTVSVVPVSAMTKFDPEMPMSAREEVLAQRLARLARHAPGSR